MKTKLKSIFLMSFLMTAACVTINVYFPAAEVESVAKEIVNEVMGGDEAPEKDDQSGLFSPGVINQIATAVNPINWFVSAAHAQDSVDITSSSPAINALKEKMKARFNESIKSYLDQNVVGFNNAGFVEIVDSSQLPLKERQSIKKVVADENRDREALYREVAIANNHPEWEERIRETFVKQWIEQAKTGWSYQNINGQWVKK